MSNADDENDGAAPRQQTSWPASPLQGSTTPSPAFGAGPPGGSPGGSSSRPALRLGRVIAACVVGGLLVAGTVTAVVLRTSGGAAQQQPDAAKGKPKPKAPFMPPSIAPVWETPAATGDTLRTGLLGTWRSDTAYFVGRGTGVEILDRVSGKSLGKVEPPEADMSPCGMTEGLNKAGMGAISWVKGDPLSSRAACDQVSLIDTRNGARPVWTASVPGAVVEKQPLTSDENRLAFLSDDVLAVMSPNTVVGLGVADKRELWTWRNPGVADHKYVLNEHMVTGRDRIMVMVALETAATQWSRTVITLDGNGTQMSAVPLPDFPVLGRKYQLLSAEPATVLLDAAAFDRSTPPEIIVFGRDGTIARRIKLSTGAGPTTPNQIDMLRTLKRFDIQLSATTVYAIADDATAESSPAQVAAYDLATGATKWVQPVDLATRPRFLSADDDTVYVLGGKAAFDMNVYAYSAESGTRTQVGTVAAPDGLLPISSLVMDYKGGELAMVRPNQGDFGAMMFRAPGA
ncbi:hypothetical protein ACWC98_26430 [Streptomyces goshikiensis]